MRPFSLLLTCFFFLGTTNPAGNSPSPELLRPNQDYALFFAVDAYAKMNNLQNPIQNARDVAAVLKSDYGFNTELVLNPTYDQIEAKIKAYQADFERGTKDRKGQLFLFFSGHGLKDYGDGYFIPADGDPGRPHRTALRYGYLRGEIDKIDCQHIMVMVDACHSATFNPAWKNKPNTRYRRPGEQFVDQTLQNHAQHRARLFITSDAVGEQTPDRSALTRQVLEGLKQYRSTTNYLTSSILASNYLERAKPAPGGGEFGSDRSAGASCFLFFRKQTDILPDVRTDLTDWRTAQSQNNCAAYRTYLGKHPYGDFAPAARTKTAPCDAEDRMIAAWVDAKQTNDCTGYEAFEKKYPASPYVTAAVGKRKELNCKAAKVPDNMIFISGGTFQMGDQFGDGSNDEKPVHPVTLPSFYLSRTELTNREYAEFLSALGNQEQGGTEWYEIESARAGISGGERSFLPKTGQDDHPVLEVSWYGAVAYCNWLSSQHGLTKVYRISGTSVTPNWSASGYRLPTEAEWEYAARSGGKKEKWAGTSKKSKLTQFANHSGEADGYSETAPVGMLRANSLGLADMAGNVWEWCWDWYDSGYYGKSIGNNPKGPETGSYRVLRGGGWDYYPEFCRAAYRSNFDPANRDSGVGFRLARSSRQGE